MVVVGTDASGLRHELGPVAWCALEELVAVSDDQNVATASVRSLAVALGVSKNTAHRALAALRHAGLITPTPIRRDAGKFDTGGYRVTVDASALARVDVAPATPASTVMQAPTRSRRGRRPGVRSSVVEQLSLLPEV